MSPSGKQWAVSGNDACMPDNLQSCADCTTCDGTLVQRGLRHVSFFTNSSSSAMAVAGTSSLPCVPFGPGDLGKLGPGVLTGVACQLSSRNVEAPRTRVPDIPRARLPDDRRLVRDAPRGRLLCDRLRLWRLVSGWATSPDTLSWLYLLASFSASLQKHRLLLPSQSLHMCTQPSSHRALARPDQQQCRVSFIAIACSNPTSLYSVSMQSRYPVEDYIDTLKINKASLVTR